jgi:hypothetical protein
MALFPLGILSAAGAGGAAFESDYELIETQILTSSQAAVVFSGLGAYSSTYKHLQIRMTARKSNSEDEGSVNGRINGATTGYSQHALRGTGSSVNSFGDANTTAGFCFYIPAAQAPSNVFGAGVIDILDPYSTTKNKTVRSFGGGRPNVQLALSSFAYYSTASITSFTVDALTPSLFVAGSRFSIYGLRG